MLSMSGMHQRDLRSALERNHWRIVEEMPGDDYSVAGVWQIARPDGSGVAHLDFEGLDEKRVRPMARSYGVRLREDPSIVAYFGRMRRSWPGELERFMTALNAWAK